MKNWVFLFLIIPNLLFAQQERSLATYNTGEHNIKMGAMGSFYANSTALTARFVQPFYAGGSITPKMKDDVSKRLASINRAGAEYNYGVFFSTKIDSLFKVPKYHLNFFISVQNRANFNTRFSEDLFRLGFYGNKQFAGDTAHLGDFELNILQYQQLQLGFINNDGLGNVFGLGLSLLKGQAHNRIDAPLLNFYTSEIGDEIDINGNIRIQQSDTNNFGIGAFNGYGASIDFYYEKEFEVFGNNKEGKGLFRFDINDLGFIGWNDKSLDYAIDTSFHFEGVFINNVFQLQDSIIQQDIDSLTEPYLNNEKNGSYISATPATIGLTIVQEYEKNAFAIGLRYMHFANYLPYLFVSTTRKFDNIFSVGGRLSYGGYGTLGAGVHLGLSLEKFQLLAGFNNLEAIALPDNALGYSGYITLAKSF